MTYAIRCDCENGHGQTLEFQHVADSGGVTALRNGHGQTLEFQHVADSGGVTALRTLGGTHPVYIEGSHSSADVDVILELQKQLRAPCGVCGGRLEWRRIA